MKAIVALAAAVALSGCANYGPYPYDTPYYGGPYYGGPYYGNGPYVVVPPHYPYYGYGYGFYDFPGLYPTYPWFGHRPHPHFRPGKPRPDANVQQPGAGSGGRGGVIGGGSGGSIAGPAANTGATGGGGSGYVPNQPPDK